jgi:hypothetical protein
MRAIDNLPAVRLGIAHAIARIWGPARTALDWLDGRMGGPYSPMVCVSTILLIGFIMKLSPALHAYLTQN